MTICKLPPPGWACSRGAGHDGPCAASPIHVTGGGEHLTDQEWEVLTDLMQRAFREAKRARDFNVTEKIRANMRGRRTM